MPNKMQTKIPQEMVTQTQLCFVQCFLGYLYHTMLFCGIYSHGLSQTHSWIFKTNDLSFG